MTIQGGNARQSQKGYTVAVHFIGTLGNGRILDSTTEDEPPVFFIGASQVFPALETAVNGMAVGEAKNVHIPAADPRGPRNERIMPEGCNH